MKQHLTFLEFPLADTDLSGYRIDNKVQFQKQTGHMTFGLPCSHGGPTVTDFSRSQLDMYALFTVTEQFS